APGKEHEHADVTARLAKNRPLLQQETGRLDAELSGWEKTVDRTKLPKEIADILAVPAEKRNAKQKQQLAGHHHNSSERYRALEREVRALDARRKQLVSSTPILREIKPRPTHVHIRGDFLDKGEAVSPGLPAIFSESVKPPVGAGPRAGPDR